MHHQDKDPEGSVQNSKLRVYSCFSLFTFPGLRHEAGQQKHEVHLSDWGQPALEWYKMLQIGRASLRLLETSWFTRELLKDFDNVQDHHVLRKGTRLSHCLKCLRCLSIYTQLLLMCLPVWIAQSGEEGGIGSSGELFSVNKRSSFPMGY